MKMCYDKDMTTQEKIDLVDAAIERVLTDGQSEEIDGKTYTRADLGVLNQMRKDLEAKLAAESLRVSIPNRWTAWRLDRGC